MATAILVADRAVVMEDLRGNKIRGTGINLMKLVEEQPYSLDQLVENLKFYLRVVKIDKEAR